MSGSRVHPCCCDCFYEAVQCECDPEDSPYRLFVPCPVVDEVVENGLPPDCAQGDNGHIFFKDSFQLFCWEIDPLNLDRRGPIPADCEQQGGTEDCRIQAHFPECYFNCGDCCGVLCCFCNRNTGSCLDTDPGPGCGIAATDGTPPGDHHHGFAESGLGVQSGAADSDAEVSVQGGDCIITNREPNCFGIGDLVLFTASSGTFVTHHTSEDCGGSGGGECRFTADAHTVCGIYQVVPLPPDFGCPGCICQSPSACGLQLCLRKVCERGSDQFELCLSGCIFYCCDFFAPSFGWSRTSAVPCCPMSICATILGSGKELPDGTFIPGCGQPTDEIEECVCPAPPGPDEGLCGGREIRINYTPCSATFTCRSCYNAHPSNIPGVFECRVFTKTFSFRVVSNSCNYDNTEGRCFPVIGPQAGGCPPTPRSCC